MEDITALTGLPSVRKLNDRLQTLTGALMSFTDTPRIVTLEIVPSWPFTGFAQPIDAPPVLNRVRAGNEVTLRFGVGGDRGLSIFATGSPSSVEISCATGQALGTATTIPPTEVGVRCASWT